MIMNIEAFGRIEINPPSTSIVAVQKMIAEPNQIQVDKRNQQA